MEKPKSPQGLLLVLFSRVTPDRDLNAINQILLNHVQGKCFHVLTIMLFFHF